MTKYGPPRYCLRCAEQSEFQHARTTIENKPDRSALSDAPSVDSRSVSQLGNRAVSLRDDLLERSSHANVGVNGRLADREVEITSVLGLHYVASVDVCVATGASLG